MESQPSSQVTPYSQPRGRSPPRNTMTTGWPRSRTGTRVYTDHQLILFIGTVNNFVSSGKLVKQHIPLLPFTPYP